MIRLMLKNEAGIELEVLEDVTKHDFSKPETWAFVAGAIGQTLHEVAVAAAEGERAAKGEA